MPVPSRVLSKSALWYSLPDRLCRFGVQFDVTPTSRRGLFTQEARHLLLQHRNYLNHHAIAYAVTGFAGKPAYTSAKDIVSGQHSLLYSPCSNTKYGNVACFHVRLFGSPARGRLAPLLINVGPDLRSSAGELPHAIVLHISVRASDHSTSYTGRHETCGTLPGTAAPVLIAAHLAPPGAWLAVHAHLRAQADFRPTTMRFLLQ